MIYEAILSSSETDLEIFYGLREHIKMDQIIHDLNCLYKYDKRTWIRKREAAIREKIEKQKEDDQRQILLQKILDRATKDKQKKGDQANSGGQKRVYPNKKAIKAKSRREFAAYVYLVLKVGLDHPSLYQLINVCGSKSAGDEV
jgi:uncharacterized protein YyaL (SSP411 family)